MLDHFQGRGVVIFLLGVASLLLFDNDLSAPPVEHRILLTCLCSPSIVCVCMCIVGISTVCVLPLCIVGICAVMYVFVGVTMDTYYYITVPLNLLATRHVHSNTRHTKNYNCGYSL